MAKLSWSLLCCIALWHCRSSCAVRGDKPELPTLKRQRQRLGSTSAASKTGSASEGPRSLKRKVAETFLSNKLSAKDIFELSDAANAEACSQGASSSVRDLAQAGARGAHPQNFARDILARLVRGTAHQLFWHPIPFYDPKAKEDIVLSHPFLLPHEMILGLVHAHGLENFLIDSGAAIFATLDQQCRRWSLDPSVVVPIGLHGDGVPYTKKESLEVVSFNFLSAPTGDRIPFTALSKKNCTAATWAAVFEVLVWSLRMLFAGRVSKYLPGGSEWTARAKRKMSCDDGSFSFRAMLLQVRGDWPFLRQLFCFPSWSSHSICWKCAASNSEPETNVLSYQHTHAGAAWRSSRISETEFLRRLHAQGVQINPLLGLQNFCLSMVVLDWLHVVDLGVGADVLGNLFYTALTYKGAQLLAGRTKDERLVSLWKKLREWYSINKQASMLDNLTHEMIRRDGGQKKPRLKAKGAEARYLYKFGLDLATSFYEQIPGDEFLKTVAALFRELVCMQDLVSGDAADYDPQKGSAACRRFCTLYKTLRDASEFPFWQLKPKLHLLQELMEYQSPVFGSPRLYWCYRDESWCGFWAKAAKRRGGANNPNTTAKNFLLRFLAAEDQKTEG